MPCCKNRSLLSGLVLFVSLWLASLAHADGISVQRAEGRYFDNSYQLSADFDINFNFVVEQALTRGITLYFVSEFTLTRQRWYWFDEEAVHSEQTVKLSYNALTRQYRLAHGALYQNFSSLEDALNTLGHQSSPSISISSLKKNTDHIASLRMRLDVTQLPKPLQVNALAGNDWNLDSGWYHWIVRPGAAANN